MLFHQIPPDSYIFSARSGNAIQSLFPTIFLHFADGNGWGRLQKLVPQSTHYDRTDYKGNLAAVQQIQRPARFSKPGRSKAAEMETANVSRASIWSCASFPEISAEEKLSEYPLSWA